MDMRLARWVNQSLKNRAEDAVLEMITTGVTISFDQETNLCFSPNIESVTVNEINVNHRSTIKILSGDVVQIGRFSKGNFAYLGIAGGWKTELVLGSRSMYVGITAQGRLMKGDVLPYESMVRDDEVVSFRESELLTSTSIDVFKGPEYDQLPENLRSRLIEYDYSISRSWNRMAFTASTGIPMRLDELKTVPVMPGTVQLTPGGDLLFLMCDAQTTGGYPRIFQVPTKYLNILRK